MVERQHYEVVGTLPGGIEIRHYPEHRVVSVEVDAELEQAGNLGFRPLVSYISGYNAARQKIAMTTPVLQEPVRAEHYTVSFVLPQGVESWPEPMQPGLALRTVPPALVAALRFRGYWRGGLVRSQEQKLLEGLKDTGYQPTGSAFYARYDPPSVPGMFRRNEVLVPVEASAS